MRHIKWLALISILMFSFGGFQTDTFGLTIESVPTQQGDWEKFCYKFIPIKEIKVPSEQEYFLGCKHRFYGKIIKEERGPITLDLDRLKYRKHRRYEEIIIRLNKNIREDIEDPVLFEYRRDDWIVIGSGEGDSDLDLYARLAEEGIMVSPPQSVFPLGSTDEPEEDDPTYIRIDEGVIYTDPDEGRPYRDPSRETAPIPQPPTPSQETIPADQLEGEGSRPPYCPPCPPVSRPCPPNPLNSYAFSQLDCDELERALDGLITTTMSTHGRRWRFDANGNRVIEDDPARAQLPDILQQKIDETLLAFLEMKIWICEQKGEDESQNRDVLRALRNLIRSKY